MYPNPVSTRKIVVYIASPYTKGDVGANVHNSSVVADALLSFGYVPFPPILFSHLWHLISPKPYDVWMEMDYEYILRCDCLLRVPGKSGGADNEVKFAQDNHIPVFYSLEDLDNYYRG